MLRRDLQLHLQLLERMRQRVLHQRDIGDVPAGNDPDAMWRDRDAVLGLHACGGGAALPKQRDMRMQRIVGLSGRSGLQPDDPYVRSVRDQRDMRWRMLYRRNLCSRHSADCVRVIGKRLR